jgi:hypothetical protein
MHTARQGFWAGGAGKGAVFGHLFGLGKKSGRGPEARGKRPEGSKAVFRLTGFGWLNLRWTARVLW